MQSRSGGNHEGLTNAGHRVPEKQCFVDVDITLDDHPAHINPLTMLADFPRLGNITRFSCQVPQFSEIYAEKGLLHRIVSPV